MFLTGRGLEMDRIAGLKMGADDYVVKPFSSGELSARIESVLRRRGAGSAVGDHVREAPDLLSGRAHDGSADDRRRQERFARSHAPSIHWWSTQAPPR